MKSEERMSPKTRRRYTEDFKHEAVRLVRESARPVAQVARDLGIPENRLYRWRANTGRLNRRAPHELVNVSKLRTSAG